MPLGVVVERRDGPDGTAGVLMSGKQRRFSDVEIGAVLPELAIAVTTSSIVAGAIASRDYTPVQCKSRNIKHKI